MQLANVALQRWRTLPFPFQVCLDPTMKHKALVTLLAPACWSGVREATTFGAICPQRPVEQGKPNDPNAPVQGDEDCLTLNVWAPADATVRASQPRPVMVFIHGGGNIQGAGSESAYDGTVLAESGGVVLVTFNYRLGPLGFLAHPALTAERAERASGNLGILDQIAALSWVKRNIAAFGGDPGRVMIFGESAGGVNTCTLVASPRAAGLFHGALVQSGGCVGNRALADAETFGQTVAQAAGCATGDVAACLRSKTAAALIDAGPANGINNLNLGPADCGPIVDGFVLTQVPFNAILAGKHNKVPLIFGANEDETNLMVGASPKTAIEYATVLSEFFGPTLGAKVLAQYPASRFPTPRAAAVAVTSDYRFICPVGPYVQAALDGGSPSAFRYFFTKSRDVSPTAALFGAFHGLELGFLFHTMKMPTVTESALSNAMLGYWTRFAATGDPNGGGAPVWPTAKKGSDPYLELGTTVAAKEGVRVSDCAFWETALK